MIAPPSRTAPSSPGLVESVRRLGSCLLGTVHQRVELFSLELHEEKLRLIQALVWISVALFTGVMSAVLGTLAIVLLFRDSARIAALAALALLYGGAAVALVVGFRRFLARQPRPLAATLEELAADRSCLNRED